MSKTIAEKLRGITSQDTYCNVDYIVLTLTGERAKCVAGGAACDTCYEAWFHKLADAIEAEQAELRKAIDFTERGEADGEVIPSISRELPEGIEWPRYADGEMVKYGDEIEGLPGPVDGFEVFDDGSWCVTHDGEAFYGNQRIHATRKRPEPEVLDADGVPVKVGDTVYLTVGEITISEGRTVKRIKSWPSYKVFFEETPAWAYASDLTHRKPDTQEAIDADVCKTACEYFDGAERASCYGCKSPKAPKHEDDDGMYSACREEQTRDLLKRQRELLGGE